MPHICRRSVALPRAQRCIRRRCERLEPLRPLSLSRLASKFHVVAPKAAAARRNRPAVELTEDWQGICMNVDADQDKSGKSVVWESTCALQHAKRCRVRARLCVCSLQEQRAIINSVKQCTQDLDWQAVGPWGSWGSWGAGADERQTFCFRIQLGESQGPLRIWKFVW